MPTPRKADHLHALAGERPPVRPRAGGLHIEPPDDLGGRALDVWRELAEIVGVTSRDRHAFALCCKALAKVDDLYEHTAAHPEDWRAATRLVQADQAAQRWSDRFGLSPKARQSLTVDDSDAADPLGPERLLS